MLVEPVVTPGKSDWRASSGELNAEDPSQEIECRWGYILIAR